MTSSRLSSGTCIRLFPHGIHVGAYLRGFRTPATSITEHIVAIAIFLFVVVFFFQMFVDDY